MVVTGTHIFPDFSVKRETANFMRGSTDWVATFLECRTRDLPVENLSPRNNTVALALSGCVTPGNGSCTCPCLFVFRLLSLYALHASLRERGRVRIIMALRVLTLHLLSQLVIHISPHVPLSPCRVLFFSPRIRPSRIYPTSWFGACAVFTEPRAKGSREHYRKIELEMARPDKMSDTMIASVQRNSVKL